MPQYIPVTRFVNRFLRQPFNPIATFISLYTLTFSKTSLIYPTMSRFRAILSPLFTSLTFAGSFVAAKFAIAALDPVAITFYRYLVALLFLTSLMLWQKLPWRGGLTRLDFLKLFLMGLTGIVGYHYFFFLSLRYTAVAHSAIINGFSPVVTGLLAAIFIKEKLTLKNYLGVIIAISGVMILITDGNLQILFTLGFNKGDLLMLCAVFCWGIYAVIARRLLEKHPSLTVTLYSAFSGVLILTVLTVGDNPIPDKAALSPVVLLSILYMGLIASGIGYYLYNISIRQIGPTRTSSFVNSVVPVAVSILAFLFFKEPLRPIMGLSILLIIIGLRLMLRHSD